MSNRDWNDEGENGCYQNVCCNCKKMFIGHRSRVVCLRCTIKDEAMTSPAPVAGSEPTVLHRYTFERMADWNVGLFDGENPGALGIGFTADEALASALYHASPRRASPAPIAASGAEMPRVTAEDVALLRRGVIASEDWQGPQRECPNFDEAMARQKRILAAVEYALAHQPPLTPTGNRHES